MEYKIARLSNPPRYFIDLDGVRVGDRVNPKVELQDDYIKSVRIAQFNDTVVRVVLDLSSASPLTALTHAENLGILVELRPAGGAARQPKSAPRSMSSPATHLASATASSPRSDNVPTPSVRQNLDLPKVYRLEVETSEDKTRVFIGLQRIVKHQSGRAKTTGMRYLELPGIRLGPWAKPMLEVDDGRLLRVQLEQHDQRRTRVYLDSEAELEPIVSIQQSPPGLVVEFIGEKKSAIPITGRERSVARDGVRRPDSDASGLGASRVLKVLPESAHSLYLVPADTLAIPLTDRPPQIGEIVNGVGGTAPQTSSFREQEVAVSVDSDTLASLVYDSSNLYVIFRCESSPQEGRFGGTLARPGVEDQVAVYLIKEERTFLFISDSSGNQRQGLAIGGQDPDFAVELPWKSSSRAIDQGYVVLIEIPWESLGYSEAAGRNWKLALGRKRGRSEENIVWP